MIERRLPNITLNLKRGKIKIEYSTTENINDRLND